MQLDRFTIKSQEALQAAIRLAADRRNTETAPPHLLLALLDQDGGIVGPVLRKVGADPAASSTASPPPPPAPASRAPRVSCSTSCAPPSARPASCATSTSPPSISC